MADSPASLRRRIDSAGDLQSIVRAMKAQAAAAIGQYEASVAALGDYARTVELGLGACLRAQPVVVQTPPHAGRPAAIHVIVFGSDQGLVGRFNDVVVEHAVATLGAAAASASFWSVGDRASGALADHRLTLRGSYAVPGSVQSITPLIARLLADCTQTATRDMATPANGAAPELHLFYNRPSGGAAYVPVSQRLLPLDAAWRRSMTERPWPTHVLPQVIAAPACDGVANDMDFDETDSATTALAGPADTLRALTDEHLFVSLFRACAESLASENASRLAAMDRAERNIDTMLTTLGDSFHRLRQSAIDEELSDVVSGFKALQGPGA